MMKVNDGNDVHSFEFSSAFTLNHLFVKKSFYFSIAFNGAKEIIVKTPKLGI